MRFRVALQEQRCGSSKQNVAARWMIVIHAREFSMRGFSGAGFSLWVLGLARPKPRRLKPAPLKNYSSFLRAKM